MNPILQVMADIYKLDYIGYAFVLLLVSCVFFKLLYRRDSK